MLYHISVVIDTTKVRLFKQITTYSSWINIGTRCYWYHKGKTFQANHNRSTYRQSDFPVVIDTTKVRLFKQITTYDLQENFFTRCYWYHKGKTFQANHNSSLVVVACGTVVIDTTKVRLFKQITTTQGKVKNNTSCYWYHKGKTFQANHNINKNRKEARHVVIDTTKVRLFKQITTVPVNLYTRSRLLLIPQR